MEVFECDLWVRSTIFQTIDRQVKYQINRVETCYIFFFLHI